MEIIGSIWSQRWGEQFNIITHQPASEESWLKVVKLNCYCDHETLNLYMIYNHNKMPGKKVIYGVTAGLHCCFAANVIFSFHSYCLFKVLNCTSYQTKVPGVHMQFWAKMLQCNVPLLSNENKRNKNSGVLAQTLNNVVSVKSQSTKGSK